MKKEILNYFNREFTAFYERLLNGTMKRENTIQLKTLCPFHEDHVPSLSINMQSGKWCCHGCQKRGDIFSFYGNLNGLSTKTQFPQILDNIIKDFQIPIREKSDKKLRRIVKVYDYHDAEGKIVHQTVRYDPKEFRQRRPNRKGGYIWNMKDIEPVLYNLPAVGNAKEVFVVEGEKDADTLNELGFVASTCPMGAGKWRSSYNEYLIDKDVVIIPDNDNPGLTHAERIAHRLYGKVSSIKILKPPEMKEGHDITNFIESYQDKQAASERLSIMVEECAFWKPEDNANGDGKPNDSAESVDNYNLTDLGNAERLVHEYGGEIRYCHHYGKWFVWDGRQWKIDETGEMYRRGKSTIRSIIKYADKITQDDKRKDLIRHSLRSESDYKIRAMIKLAESEDQIPIAPIEFDTDPWLLNCLNGTIDLRTGELKPHRREDLITKLILVNYDLNAKCTLWENFLNRIMNNNLQFIAFLQRMMGYSLTGVIKEQCLFFLYGRGANGKTTLLETVRLIIGDYAKQTDFNTIYSHKSEKVRNDIAGLVGARFVVSVEVELGKRLDEVLIKQITGGDKITARKLYREFFEFTPTFKLFIAGNHKPQIRGTDEGIWRRIKLIPFDVTIPEMERDPEYPEKLQKELPGILAWAVRGCLDWQKNGLGVPQEVKNATEAYRDEMDIVSNFIKDCCLVDSNSKVLAKVIFQRYEMWCEDNGDKPIFQRTFGMKLREKGFNSVRGTGGVSCWEGLALTE